VTVTILTTRRDLLLQASTLTLTPEGIRVAVFYTKVRARLLGPLLEADQAPATGDLRSALGTIEHVLGDYVSSARLGIAA